jgi:hypothetical protein
MENHDSIVPGTVGSSQGCSSTGATGDSAGQGGADSGPLDGTCPSRLEASPIVASNGASGPYTKRKRKVPSSEKQIAASRRNGRRSLGPKTPQGKARSSRNSYKLGIFAQKLFPPTEQGCREWETYNELVTGFYGYYRPQNAIEELLVDKVVSETLRYARILGIESQEISRPGAFWNSAVDKVLRSQTAIHRQLVKAIAQLEDVQANRKTAERSSKTSRDGSDQPCEVLWEHASGEKEKPKKLAQAIGSGTRPVRVEPSLGAIAVQPLVPSSGEPSASPAGIANSGPIQTENYKTNPPSTLSDKAETAHEETVQKRSLVDIVERIAGLAAPIETKDGPVPESDFRAQSPDAAPQGPSEDDILDCV